MSDRPKLIYLARRHPSIEQASFAARWRQHGRLGMSLPRWRNIWRYAQCDALPWAASPMPLAGECDGVGLVWYRSDEARARHVDDGDRAVMARDELEAFDRPVRQSAFLARETLLRPPPAGGVKLFCFLFARPGIARAEMTGCIEGGAEVLTGALREGGGGAGYILNVAGEEAAAAPGDGLGCVAVDELAFESVALAERLLTPAVTAALAARRGTVIERMISVLTREIVLYHVEAPRGAMPGAAE